MIHSQKAIQIDFEGKQPIDRTVGKWICVWVWWRTLLNQKVDAKRQSKLCLQACPHTHIYKTSHSKNTLTHSDFSLYLKQCVSHQITAFRLEQGECVRVQNVMLVRGLPVCGVTSRSMVFWERLGHTVDRSFFNSASESRWATMPGDTQRHTLNLFIQTHRSTASHSTVYSVVIKKGGKERQKKWSSSNCIYETEHSMCSWGLKWELSIRSADRCSEGRKQDPDLIRNTQPSNDFKWRFTHLLISTIKKLKGWL